MVWENLPAGQAQLLAQDVAAFQEEFPQYLVTLHHYDNPEAFMTPILADEIEFDIVRAPPGLLSSLQAEGRVAPLSEFFSPNFIDSFAGVTLQGAKRDGELWGVADTAGFHLLLFYNRELVDSPPTNTKELAALSKTLAEEKNLTGLALNSYDPLWLVPWLAPYGGWLTDEAGHATLDTPAMIAALNLHLEWQRGMGTALTYDVVRKKFVEGEVAMVIDGEWAITELASRENFNWGVARLPDVSQGDETQPAAPLVLAHYWAISRSATGERAQAAAAFLEYITRPERQLAWTNRFGLLPTRREALDDPLIANDPTLRVSAEQMLAGRAIALGVNANALLNAMRAPLEEALTGKLSPQEAAPQMQTNAENN